MTLKRKASEKFGPWNAYQPRAEWMLVPDRLLDPSQ